MHRSPSSRPSFEQALVVLRKCKTEIIAFKQDEASSGQTRLKDVVVLKSAFLSTSSAVASSFYSGLLAASPSALRSKSELKGGEDYAIKASLASQKKRKIVCLLIFLILAAAALATVLVISKKNISNSSASSSANMAENTAGISEVMTATVSPIALTTSSSQSSTNAMTEIVSPTTLTRSANVVMPTPAPGIIGCANNGILGDTNNCGACDSVCRSSEVCENGICRSTIIDGACYT